MTDAQIDNKKLIVLVPAYNEEKNILKVIKKIPAKINGIRKISVLVVDDGSTDGTPEIVKRENQILLIRHNCNQGLGVAMASGIKYALRNNFDIAVNIDADGQFSPEEIPTLIQPILDMRADFVAGNRFFCGRPPKMPRIKYYGNIIMTRLIVYLSGEKFQDVSCGFRAYNRETLLNLNLFGRFTYTQEMFIDIKFKYLRIEKIPVSVRYFDDRKSKIAHNLVIYSWKTLTAIVRSIVYYKPLRFFGCLGIVMLVVGFFFLAFLLGHALLTGVYSPYKAHGFIGGGLMLFGALMIFIGLAADIIDKVRQVQEKILYYEKKKYYNNC